MTSAEAEPQSAKAALENLRKVVGGLRDSMSEFVGEFEEMVRVAKANGGKLPDVNEIARQVLGEKGKRRMSNDPRYIGHPRLL